MQGSDVHRILQQIRATHLHHANSVATSCTFLEQGALVSRGFAEDHRFAQTSQRSDEIDKRYGIWNSIFVDHVDIHERGGRMRGPNHYGPVMFVLDLDILLGLPEGSEVLVTKMNPIHWRDNQSTTTRWFQSAEELVTNISFGDFDKILVIQTPAGKLDFPNRQARIILDDPRRHISSGENAYAYAENRLHAAATTGRVTAYIERRECNVECSCVEKYALHTSIKFDRCFT